MKLATLSKTGGGGDNPPASLTPQQMKEWNSYVDYVDKRGYKGSKDLDRKETGLARKLFDDYLKDNPGVTIKYDDVKTVQTEMQKLRDSVRAFASRRNDPKAATLMGGISEPDGWPGSRTTQFKFPEMQLTQLHNNNVVQNKNLGLVGSGLKPTGVTVVQQQKLPPGAKLEKLQDGWYYEDPKSGDMVKWSEL